MAQIHFSDEVLMAFADGELDDRVADTVEQAMTGDLTVAAKVAGFLRSRRLARSAYQHDAASDVPPALKAAVQAQIDRFEAQQVRPPPASPAVQEAAQPARRRHVALALAASIGAVAIATGGYLAGREGSEPSLAGPIASLAAPEVSHALNTSPSGQDRNLPFGRIRMISTFRMPNGSLCREFRLHTPAGASDAVACRERDWRTTIALASAEGSGGYVPSDGADLMDNYLRSTGAGQPLSEAAEIQALREAVPPR